jgi:hypothetical protein
MKVEGQTLQPLPSSTQTAVPVKAQEQPATGTEGVGTKAAPTTVDSAIAFLNQIDAAVGKVPLRTPELIAAARKLITRPIDQDPKAPQPWIDRGKFTDFLDKYYKIDTVTKEFWGAFTGLGKDALIDGDRLKYCLKMFETYRKWTGHTLEYLAANSKVYIVPADKLEGWLKTYPGGIEALLLKTKGNPEVERAWNSAKYLTGNNEGKYNDETYKWFAVMLAVTYADKLSDDKLNEARDLDALDMKHGLVVELYDKYLLRWMMGEGDKGEKIGYGISKPEWNALLAQQKAIKKIGAEYCNNNEYALTDIKLPNAMAEQRLARAISLFNADSTKNKDEVLGLIKQLRAPGVATPVVPPSPLLAKLKEAATVEAP